MSRRPRPRLRYRTELPSFAAGRQGSPTAGRADEGGELGEAAGRTSVVLTRRSGGLPASSRVAGPLSHAPPQLCDDPLRPPTLLSRVLTFVSTPHVSSWPGGCAPGPPACEAPCWARQASDTAACREPPRHNDLHPRCVTRAEPHGPSVEPHGALKTSKCFVAHDSSSGCCHRIVMC